MAEFNWKSLEQLGEEFKKEAERLAAKLQDPATQARLKEGARVVEAQLRTALGEVSAAAGETLRRVDDALRAQRAASPPPPPPAGQPRGAEPGTPVPPAPVENPAPAGEVPGRRPRKTVGPRKKKAEGGAEARPPARKTAGPRKKLGDPDGQK
ncbi:MAG: hypothetical protein RL653_800 [Pseudomonadota bacterium]|jgi:hypothetical protein